MGNDMQIVTEMSPVCERPEYRVGVVGVDVLADRDDDLAAIGPESSRPVEAAPDLALRCAGPELQEDHRPDVAQRLVKHDTTDALHPEDITQVGQEHRLIGDALDHTRLARR